MSKITRVTVDDDIFSKLDIPERKKDGIFAESLPQFFENEEQNDEIVTTLKEEIRTLEKQIKSLEIDNACIRHENTDLNQKIDELAEMFPSAVTILGKTLESKQIKKNKWIFSRQEF